MPYEVHSRCAACEHADKFIVGNWPEHLGVYVCGSCKSLVNVPVADGQCPGCAFPPAPEDLYDYSRSIPYLGDQFLGKKEPGPLCPECGQSHLEFETRAHYNLGLVTEQAEQARETWGRDYLEKAIFRNSLAPVCDEFKLSRAKVLEYFHLDEAATPPVSQSVSFPIALDIRTHLLIRVLMDPAAWGSALSPEDLEILKKKMFG